MRRLFALLAIIPMLITPGIAYATGPVGSVPPPQYPNWSCSGICNSNNGDWSLTSGSSMVTNVPSLYTNEQVSIDVNDIVVPSNACVGITVDTLYLCVSNNNQYFWTFSNVSGSYHQIQIFCSTSCQGNYLVSVIPISAPSPTPTPNPSFTATNTPVVPPTVTPPVIAQSSHTPTITPTPISCGNGVYGYGGCPATDTPTMTATPCPSGQIALVQGGCANTGTATALAQPTSTPGPAYRNCGINVNFYNCDMLGGAAYWVAPGGVYTGNVCTPQSPFDGYGAYDLMCSSQASSPDTETQTFTVPGSGHLNVATSGDNSGACQDHFDLDGSNVQYANSPANTQSVVNWSISAGTHYIGWGGVNYATCMGYLDYVQFIPDSGGTLTPTPGAATPVPTGTATRVPTLTPVNTPSANERDCGIVRNCSLYNSYPSVDYWDVNQISTSSTDGPHWTTTCGSSTESCFYGSGFNANYWFYAPATGEFFASGKLIQADDHLYMRLYSCPSGTCTVENTITFGSNCRCGTYPINSPFSSDMGAVVSGNFYAFQFTSDTGYGERLDLANTWIGATSGATFTPIPSTPTPTPLVYHAPTSTPVPVQPPVQPTATILANIDTCLGTIQDCNLALTPIAGKIGGIPGLIATPMAPLNTSVFSPFQTIGITRGGCLSFGKLPVMIPHIQWLASPVPVRGGPTSTPDISGYVPISVTWTLPTVVGTPMRQGNFGPIDPLEFEPCNDPAIPTWGWDLSWNASTFFEWLGFFVWTIALIRRIFG